MIAAIADSLSLLWGYAWGFVETTVVVIQISLVAIALSWVCGLTAGLAEETRSKPFILASRFYVWFIRGTPTLVQIFIVYFGLPQFGMRLSPFVAGVIALGVSSGAFVAEIVRAGLLSVPAGQRESARSLGMTWLQEMWLVVMPQVLRNTIPPLTNEAITLLKNTSLLSAITVLELTLFSQMAIARTFRPFEFYITAALIYLLLTSVVSSGSRALERALAVPGR